MLRTRGIYRASAVTTSGLRLSVLGTALHVLLSFLMLALLVALTATLSSKGSHASDRGTAESECTVSNSRRCWQFRLRIAQEDHDRLEARIRYLQSIWWEATEEQKKAIDAELRRNLAAQETENGFLLAAKWYVERAKLIEEYELLGRSPEGGNEIRIEKLRKKTASLFDPKRQPYLARKLNERKSESEKHHFLESIRRDIPTLPPINQKESAQELRVQLNSATISGNPGSRPKEIREKLERRETSEETSKPRGAEGSLDRLEREFREHAARCLEFQKAKSAEAPACWQQWDRRWETFDGGVLAMQRRGLWQELNDKRNGITRELEQKENSEKMERILTTEAQFKEEARKCRDVGQSINTTEASAETLLALRGFEECRTRLERMWNTPDGGKLQEFGSTLRKELESQVVGNHNLSRLRELRIQLEDLYSTDNRYFSASGPTKCEEIPFYRAFERLRCWETRVRNSERPARMDRRTLISLHLAREDALQAATILKDGMGIKTLVLPSADGVPKSLDVDLYSQALSLQTNETRSALSAATDYQTALLHAGRLTERASSSERSEAGLALLSAARELPHFIETEAPSEQAKTLMAEIMSATINGGNSLHVPRLSDGIGIFRDTGAKGAALREVMKENPLRFSEVVVGALDGWNDQIDRAEREIEALRQLGLISERDIPSLQAGLRKHRDYAKSLYDPAKSSEAGPGWYDRILSSDLPIVNKMRIYLGELRSRMSDPANTTDYYGVSLLTEGALRIEKELAEAGLDNLRDAWRSQIQSKVANIAILQGYLNNHGNCMTENTAFSASLSDKLLAEQFSDVCRPENTPSSLSRLIEDTRKITDSYLSQHAKSAPADPRKGSGAERIAQIESFLKSRSGSDSQFTSSLYKNMASRSGNQAPSELRDKILLTQLHKYVKKHLQSILSYRCREWSRKPITGQDVESVLSGYKKYLTIDVIRSNLMDHSEVGVNHSGMVRINDRIFPQYIRALKNNKEELAGELKCPFPDVSQQELDREKNVLLYLFRAAGTDDGNPENFISQGVRTTPSLIAETLAERPDLMLAACTSAKIGKENEASRRWWRKVWEEATRNLQNPGRMVRTTAQMTGADRYVDHRILDAAANGFEQGFNRVADATGIGRLLIAGATLGTDAAAKENERALLTLAQSEAAMSAANGRINEDEYKQAIDRLKSKKTESGLSQLSLITTEALELALRRAEQQPSGGKPGKPQQSRSPARDTNKPRPRSEPPSTAEKMRESNSNSSKEYQERMREAFGN